MFISFGCLPNRKHELDEHTEMLSRRKSSITRSFARRHDDKERRLTVHWLIEQAQHHKRMIVQLESLPDILVPPAFADC